MLLEEYSGVFHCTIMSKDKNVAVRLKWSKQVFDIELRLDASPADFMDRVQRITGVPVHRQKLLSKGCWKGSLSESTDLSKINITSKTKLPLLVTLIGSADKLVEPTEKTAFIEDLTPEQLEKAVQEREQAAMVEAEGMIPALQLLPTERDDRKTETYQYNRLVTGLPQKQIESMLKQQADDGHVLLGKPVMTMGLELRRAYVNDLAVLPDGTLVSALDDGHVQMWKHGALVNDFVHEGGDGGVDSVLSFAQKPSSGAVVSFATAGRSCIRLWTEDGVALGGFPTQPGTTPDSLVELYLGTSVLCLAARLRVNVFPNPLQFHLPPQNDDERRRRAEAERRHASATATLDRLAKCTQVWFRTTANEATAPLRTLLLEPTNPMASRTTALTGLQDESSEQCNFIVTGDETGGLCMWKAVMADEGPTFEENSYFQLTSPTQRCSIVAMEAISGSRLAISTAKLQTLPASESAAALVQVPDSQAVHIFRYSNNTLTLTRTLKGHTDVVNIVHELSDGHILTAGGKYDGTVQMWTNHKSPAGADHERITVETKSIKTLDDVGYIFSLVSLKDHKPGSQHFALAAARYNTVKIFI